MFYAKHTSVSVFLVHATHVLSYLDNRPDARAALEQYGFSALQLQEGRMLFDQVQNTFRQMEDQRRKQIVATDAFHAEWKQVQRFYQVHLHAARRVLGRDARQIVRSMPSSYAKWLEHARSFYAAVLNNPTYQDALSKVNVTVNDLAQVNHLLNGVAANRDAQTQARNNVRAATQRRNLELTKSKRWFEVLMGIARVAFHDQPGMLEAIHAFPPRTQTERKPAQKAAISAIPVTQQSVTQQPVTQQPVTQQPVTQQPVTQQPVTQQPVTQQPVTQQPATVVEELVVN